MRITFRCDERAADGPAGGRLRADVVGWTDSQEFGVTFVVPRVPDGVTREEVDRLDARLRELARAAGRDLAALRRVMAGGEEGRATSTPG